ncbi:MAG TPA: hypothetical protein VL295_10955 [Gemmatimonadales bacterium]|jgi:hypothetical protein|nr:hypothetical protein [Gemmatimonadales bacterium]
MRRPLAALLLTVQLQPLWGLVLCMAVAQPQVGGDEHCADTAMSMPAEGAPQVGASGAGMGMHGCPLAEACTPSVVVSLPVDVSSSPAVSYSILPLQSADAALGLARLAPPTPPPNL